MDVQKYIRLGRRVHKYVLKNQRDGRLPTVRELAKTFHLSMADMITLIEDNDDLSYNVGVRVGGGYWIEHKIGDYTVEAEEIE